MPKGKNAARCLIFAARSEILQIKVANALKGLMRFIEPVTGLATLNSRGLPTLQVLD